MTETFLEGEARGWLAGKCLGVLGRPAQPELRIRGGRQQLGTGPSPFRVEVEGDALSSLQLLPPHPHPSPPPLPKAQQPFSGIHLELVFLLCVFLLLLVF